MSKKISGQILNARPSWRLPRVPYGVLAGCTASLSLMSVSALGADNTGVLQDIVVTATRHEASLSTVPISVSAMSQEMLDQKGIKDFQDVVRFTPGVTIDNTGTNAISIRGISSSGGSGTTGIYVDDTPIQMRALGYNPDDTLPKTFDLDRIEVLRGPQGTLFGSGSEGGTVRYIMTQPSVSTASTYARTELSFTKNGDPSYEAGLAHGGPLIDDVLGYRASIWYRKDGGWINRVDSTSGALTEKNANYADTVSARLALLIKPNERLRITPSVTYQNSRKHDESTYWTAYSQPDAGVFNNATPERIPVPDEYYLPALKIEADIGKTTLVSNSSYYNRYEQSGYQGTVYDLGYYQNQGWLIGQCGSASSSQTTPCSWYPLLDGKGTHLPAGFSGYSTPNTMTNAQETWTQEVRLQSNNPDSKLVWTVGAFWSVSRETSTEQLNDSQIIPFWQALFGISPLDYFGPYYACNGQGVAGQTTPNCSIYYNKNTAHDRQLAGFGEASYALTDRLKVTLGGRIAKLGFSLSHHGDGLENYGPNDAAAQQSETAFTPKVGLSFQADPRHLYYATYAKGFRPGGGNAPLPPYCEGDGGLNQTGYTTGAPLTYKSDTTQSYEIGSKNNFNNRVKIATSLYYIKWANIQQNVYVAYNCGLQFTDNLGSAVAKGFDVQAEMILGAGFTLDAALGYTSARYDESTTAPKPLLVQAGDAISGEAAINGGPGTNPPWTLSLGAQYDFAIHEKDAFIRVDWAYTARNTWLAAIQDPATAQYTPNTYALSSTAFASVRAGINVGHWQLAAFIDNAFNSHTTTNYQQQTLDPYNPNYLANPYTPTSVQRNEYTFRPRTIGVTVTMKL